MENKSKIYEYRSFLAQQFDCDAGVKNIASLVSEIDKYAEFSVSEEQNALKKQEKSNKIKGDLFEVFAEIFFKAFGADNQVGLSNYKVVLIEDDYGVDAIGINANNDQCAVQIKFRSNPSDEIEFSCLAKTDSSAKRLEGIDTNKDNTIFLFTSASGATKAANMVLSKSLRVINRKIISNKIDENHNFWIFAENFIISALDEIYGENN